MRGFRLRSDDLRGSRGRILGVHNVEDSREHVAACSGGKGIEEAAGQVNHRPV